MRSQNAAQLQRKKQEEQNAQAIRKLLALPENKFCFECGQRGPTYVNVTNFSFCCMHCSGLLRGLHPPHRVKSISMATFSADEVEKLRANGNALNARIFLGLYDGRTCFEPRVEEEVRAHLVDKYEQRRWYVSPGDVELQKRLLEEHEAAHRRNSLSGQSVKSHKSNQSAPPNMQANNKPPGPVDLLTGDLFDLSFGAPTSSALPAPAAPIPVPSSSRSAAATLPDDDWTSLFTDQSAAPSVPPSTAAVKQPLQPTSSFPFAASSSVPAPLRFPMPVIPPPKPREHHHGQQATTSSSSTSHQPHSVSFADFDPMAAEPAAAQPSASSSSASALPAGWESFSGVPKSATVGVMNAQGEQTGQETSPNSAAKKVAPPVPASRPVACKQFNGAGDPFAGASPAPPGQPSNWNPFLG